MNPVHSGSKLSFVDSIQKPAQKPVFAASLLVQDQLQVRFGKANAVRDREHVENFRQQGMVVAGGGGLMGPGIAANALSIGVPVHLADLKQEWAEGGRSRIEAGVNEAVAKGIYSQEEADKQLGLIKGTYGTGHDQQTPVENIPADVALAIEAVNEDSDDKEKLFKRLDAHFGPDTILATNTSSLSVDDLAQSVSPERRKNFVGIHYFNPANKNAFIEVIRGKDTSDATMEKAVALVKAAGKTPIVCDKDAPGFVVNRMLVPVMNEGIRTYDRMVRESGANEQQAAVIAANIEQAVKEVLWPTFSQKEGVSGLLIGPFSGLNTPDYMGLIGLIAPNLHEKLGDGYKPADSVLEKSAAFLAAGGKRASKEAFEALKFPVAGPESFDREMIDQLKNHFMGLVIGVATQLVDEGVTTPANVNKGVMIGTQWELAPFELINEIGTKRSLELVEAYRQTNPDFKRSQVLVDHARNNKEFALDYVTTRKEGSTGYVTVDKLQRENALDMAMLQKLEAAFDEMHADPQVKTIVFESVGGKRFVAGADIFALQDQMKEIKNNVRGRWGFLPRPLTNGIEMATKYATLYPFLTKGIKVYDKIAASSKPTVAKVNGDALGGGTELALACDYIVASEKARFGLPEVKYGIFPAWGGTERLAERVGTSLAKFMVLEGGKADDRMKGDAVLNAADAQTIGLTDWVVPHNELDETVSGMLAEGTFDVKPMRCGVPPASAAYANSRFPAKQSRYAGASLNDLMANELEGVYKPAAALAFSRVTRGAMPNRLTQERELLQMAMNMAAVEARAKK